MVCHSRCTPAAPALQRSNFVQAILDVSFGMDFPERLIGDKAYDSGGLDVESELLGIEMIALN